MGLTLAKNLYTFAGIKSTLYQIHACRTNNYYCISGPDYCFLYLASEDCCSKQMVILIALFPSASEAQKKKQKHHNQVLTGGVLSFMFGLTPQFMTTGSGHESELKPPIRTQISPDHHMVHIALEEPGGREGKEGDCLIWRG